MNTVKKVRKSNKFQRGNGAIIKKSKRGRKPKSTSILEISPIRRSNRPRIRTPGEIITIDLDDSDTENNYGNVTYNISADHTPIHTKINSKDQSIYEISVENIPSQIIPNDLSKNDVIEMEKSSFTLQNTTPLPSNTNTFSSPSPVNTKLLSNSVNIDHISTIQNTPKNDKAIEPSSQMEKSVLSNDIPDGTCTQDINTTTINNLNNENDTKTPSNLSPPLLTKSSTTKINMNSSSKDLLSNSFIPKWNIKLPESILKLNLSDFSTNSSLKNSSSVRTLIPTSFTKINSSNNADSKSTTKKPNSILKTVTIFNDNLSSDIYSQINTLLQDESSIILKGNDTMDMGENIPINSNENSVKFNDKEKTVEFVVTEKIGSTFNEYKFKTKGKKLAFYCYNNKKYIVNNANSAIYTIKDTKIDNEEINSTLSYLLNNIKKSVNIPKISHNVSRISKYSLQYKYPVSLPSNKLDAILEDEPESTFNVSYEKLISSEKQSLKDSTKRKTKTNRVPKESSKTPLKNTDNNKKGSVTERKRKRVNETDNNEKARDNSSKYNAMDNNIMDIDEGEKIQKDKAEKCINPEKKKGERPQAKSTNEGINKVERKRGRKPKKRKLDTTGNLTTKNTTTVKPLKDSQENTEVKLENIVIKKEFENKRDLRSNENGPHEIIIIDLDSDVEDKSKEKAQSPPPPPPSKKKRGPKPKALQVDKTNKANPRVDEKESSEESESNLKLSLRRKNRKLNPKKDLKLRKNKLNKSNKSEKTDQTSKNEKETAMKKKEKSISNKNGSIEKFIEKTVPVVENSPKNKKVEKNEKITMENKKIENKKVEGKKVIDNKKNENKRIEEKKVGSKKGETKNTTADNKKIENKTVEDTIKTIENNKVENKDNEMVCEEVTNTKTKAKKLESTSFMDVVDETSMNVEEDNSEKFIKNSIVPFNIKKLKSQERKNTLIKKEDKDEKEIKTGKQQNEKEEEPVQKKLKVEEPKDKLITNQSKPMKLEEYDIDEELKKKNVLPKDLVELAIENKFPETLIEALKNGRCTSIINKPKEELEEKPIPVVIDIEDSPMIRKTKGSERRKRNTINCVIEISDNDNDDADIEEENREIVTLSNKNKRFKNISKGIPSILFPPSPSDTTNKNSPDSGNSISSLSSSALNASVMNLKLTPPKMDRLYINKRKYGKDLNSQLSSHPITSDSRKRKSIEDTQNLVKKEKGEVHQHIVIDSESDAKSEKEVPVVSGVNNMSYESDESLNNYRNGYKMATNMFNYNNTYRPPYNYFSKRRPSFDSYFDTLHTRPKSGFYNYNMNPHKPISAYYNHVRTPAPTPSYMYMNKSNYPYMSRNGSMVNNYYSPNIPYNNFMSQSNYLYNVGSQGQYYNNSFLYPPLSTSADLGPLAASSFPSSLSSTAFNSPLMTTLPSNPLNNPLAPSTLSTANNSIPKDNVPILDSFSNPKFELDIDVLSLALNQNLNQLSKENINDINALEKKEHEKLEKSKKKSSETEKVKNKSSGSKSSTKTSKAKGTIDATSLPLDTASFYPDNSVNPIVLNEIPIENLLKDISMTNLPDASLDKSQPTNISPIHTSNNSKLQDILSTPTISANKLDILGTPNFSEKLSEIISTPNFNNGKLSVIVNTPNLNSNFIKNIEDSGVCLSSTTVPTEDLSSQTIEDEAKLASSITAPTTTTTTTTITTTSLASSAVTTAIDTSALTTPLDSVNPLPTTMEVETTSSLATLASLAASSSLITTETEKNQSREANVTTKPFESVSNNFNALETLATLATSELSETASIPTTTTHGPSSTLQTSTEATTKDQTNANESKEQKEKGKKDKTKEKVPIEEKEDKNKSDNTGSKDKQSSDAQKQKPIDNLINTYVSEPNPKASTDNKKEEGIEEKSENSKNEEKNKGAKPSNKSPSKLEATKRAMDEIMSQIIEVKESKDTLDFLAAQLSNNKSSKAKEKEEENKKSSQDQNDMSGFNGNVYMDRNPILGGVENGQMNKVNEEEPQLEQIIFKQAVLNEDTFYYPYVGNFNDSSTTSVTTNALEKKENGSKEVKNTKDINPMNMYNIMNERNGQQQKKQEANTTDQQNKSNDLMNKFYTEEERKNLSVFNGFSNLQNNESLNTMNGSLLMNKFYTEEERNTLFNNISNTQPPHDESFIKINDMEMNLMENNTNKLNDSNNNKHSVIEKDKSKGNNNSEASDSSNDTDSEDDILTNLNVSK
ncbi:hypothetical protein BCR36DRAFT_443735 [Piromyces finnis]|uniref:Uncharacterized protein n=1 Tax=Piromyces finnis TaxID=1754191 RepID=A0A1Y1VDQ3_9FUNG|nr:hypothetical protein BCR36DRAFT_443735 [Piromyces finnis]|eukprot:ORX52904.1 hypothetical protein BCR36DRAFT_443735 [Piromyces finnis]